MRTYHIIDEATGQIVAIQRWNDDVAPTVQPGQVSVQVEDEDQPPPASEKPVAGTFDKPGACEPHALAGDLDVTIAGEFNATIQLEYSDNEGVTWKSVQDNEQGMPFAWSDPDEIALADMPSGLYRLNCVRYEGGVVDYTIAGGVPEVTTTAAPEEAGTMSGGPSPEAIPEDQRPTPGDAAQGGSGAEPAPARDPVEVGGGADQQGDKQEDKPGDQPEHADQSADAPADTEQK